MAGSNIKRVRKTRSDKGKFTDLTGNKYGRLEVLSLSHVKREKNQSIYMWTCKCECGVVKEIRYQSLASGSSKSCGCLRAEVCSSTGKSNKTHGKRNTKEYKLWDSAKQRARKYNKEFNIELSDIVIPDMCPIFLMPIDKALTKLSNNSPSLDRVDNTKGYIKGNVCVISNKANSLLRDITIEQLERLLSLMKSYQTKE